MTFIAKIAFALVEAVAAIFAATNCQTCHDTPWGYTFDVDACYLCDDCMRRRLVFDRITYDAVWKEFMKGSPEAVKVVDSICEDDLLYMSPEMSGAFISKSLTSKYLYPSNDEASKSYKAFVADIRSRGDVEVAGTSVTIEDSMDDAVVHSIGLRADIFLTENYFLGICPGLLDDDFKGLEKVLGSKPYFCENVSQEVQTFVSIGREDTGHGMARGVNAIISNSTIPTLTREGKLSQIGCYQRLAEAVSDPTCGVTRKTVINGVYLKKDFIVEPEVYYNLLYTCWIHCGFPAFQGKELVKGKCMVHRVGSVDAGDGHDEAVFKPNWIPVSYGLKTPQGVLTAEKPILAGCTSVLLQGSKLVSSLASYLTSKARLIAPTFSTLHASVQAFLLAQFHDASKVPLNIISRVVGKTPEEAATIIFSKAPANPVTTQTPVVKSVSTSSGVNAAGGAAPRKKKDVPYSSTYSKKQIKVMTSAFGGDFSCFLKIQKEHRLGGKLDLVKLANYFKEGNPNFGKLTLKQVVDKCQA